MEQKVALAAIRGGEISAADAWKLLTPMIKNVDGKVAYEMTEALRGWTWKAIDRRRRDSSLREWIDLLNRVEGFLSQRFDVLAGKIELMAELIHESVAVAERAAPEDLLKRKHIAFILGFLARTNGEWVERGALMDELGLKPANTTRLMSLLVDAGLVEQKSGGRETDYRLATEGLALASKLPAEASGQAKDIAKVAKREWDAPKGSYRIWCTQAATQQYGLLKHRWDVEMGELPLIYEPDRRDEDDGADDLPPPPPFHLHLALEGRY